MTRARVQRELRRILPKWQRELCVCDWEITLDVVSGAEAETPFGICYVDENRKRARIEITDPADFSPTKYAKYGDTYHDCEATLVHELLHVAFREVEISLSGVTGDGDLEPHQNRALEALIDTHSRCWVRRVRFSQMWGN